MSIRVEHELHGRRRSRNVGLAVVLAGFVVLVLVLTVAKVTSGQGNMLKGYDHRVHDNTYLPQMQNQPAAVQNAPEAAMPGAPAPVVKP